MTRSEMVVLAEKVVNELDARIKTRKYHHYNSDTTVWLSMVADVRWLAGEPEPQNDFPDPTILKMQIEHRLDELGVENRRVRFTKEYTYADGDTAERDWDSDDPNALCRNVWSFSVEFPFIRKYADPDTQRLIEAALDSGDWMTGISIRRQRARDNEYAPGTECKPRDAKNAKGYRWWYVTKYETEKGMRIHRLLRSDGKFTTCPAVTAIEDLP